MKRWLCVLLLVAASRADAAMMTHEDLAGLVLDSEVVVLADRIGPGATADTTRYQIALVLRGQLAEHSIDVYDSIYRTGTTTPDARAVLFLGRRDNRWHITPSGLRVIVDGKAFRFEQHDNPGPYVMVAQGPDPLDVWGIQGGQLDLASLEKAIAAAGKRVDALTAAGQLADPAKRRAAVLALLPAPELPAQDRGFYVDRFAAQARTLLATAGDLEGALMVMERDHGERWTARDVAPLDGLVAYASDAAHPGDLRAIAIAACVQHGDYLTSATAVRAIIGLVADAEPRVRAAAITAAAHLAGVMSSDAKEQKLIRQLAREGRAAITKQFAIEQDNRALLAAADAFERFSAPLPARKAEPHVAFSVEVVGSTGLVVAVHCLRSHVDLRGAMLVATQNGTVTKLASPSICTEVTSANRPANPGRYALAIEGVVDRQPVSISLGELDVDANGLQTRVP